MAQKHLVLSADREHVEMLVREIGKVRCWLTGFRAGRQEAFGIAGEDALRQVQQLLKSAKESR